MDLKDEETSDATVASFKDGVDRAMAVFDAPIVNSLKDEGLDVTICALTSQLATLLIGLKQSGQSGEAMVEGMLHGLRQTVESGEPAQFHIEVSLGH
jgi:hypothetical protein